MFSIFIFNWNLLICWFHTNPPNSPPSPHCLILGPVTHLWYLLATWLCQPWTPWFLGPHHPETGPPPPARTITLLHFTPNTLTRQFWANHFPLLISYLVIILSSAFVSPMTTLKIAFKKQLCIFYPPTAPSLTICTEQTYKCVRAKSKRASETTSCDYSHFQGLDTVLPPRWTKEFKPILACSSVSPPMGQWSHGATGTWPLAVLVLSQLWDHAPGTWDPEFHCPMPPR